MARFKQLIPAHRRTSVSLVSAPSGARASRTLALRLLVLAALVAIAALTAGDAMACPMCKAALGSHDSTHGDLVGGFFWSILFMLSMPFLIFGSLSTYMYLLVRRARREQAGRKTAVAVNSFVDAPVEERMGEPVSTERL